MPLSIDIITELQALEPAEVWVRLRGTHSALLADDVFGELGESKCRLNELENRLRTSSKPHFGLTVHEGEIQYGHLKNYSHSLTWVSNLVGSSSDAESWVEPFISTPGFVQAWLYDPEYSRWQNAEDPLVYQAAGRSIEGLPLKSNGLPFPLERQIVDTSKNPGRRVLRKGYVESVGSSMWLSPCFLERAGVSVAEMQAASWLTVAELPGGGVKLQAFNEPFTTANEEQGELQRNLRKLLYPDVCV